MKSSSGKILLLALLMFAVYLFSVLCLGYSAESLFNRGLEKTNLYLDSQQRLLGGRLELHYQRQERSLLSERGLLVLTNLQTSQQVKLPATLSYGLLSLQGEVDLYHFLNNLWLKNGILGLDSQAQASFRLRLFPEDLRVRLILQGPYTQDYLKRDFKHLYGYDRKLKALLCLHYNTLGTVNTQLMLEHLARPDLTAERLWVNGVNLQREDFSDSALDLRLEGLFAHGTPFDDLNALSCQVRTATRPQSDRLELALALGLESARGRLEGRLTLAPLSLQALAAQRVDLLGLSLQPLSFSRFLGEQGAVAELESLKFAADYVGYKGPVKYLAYSQGRLHLPKGESLVDMLDRLEGQFKLEFAEVSEAGRQVLESLGSGYVQKRGDLFVSDVTVSAGNIWLNGKEYR